MVFSSVIEAFSIGAIVPFIGAITNPEYIINNKNIGDILLTLNIVNQKDVIYFFSISFILTVLIAGIFRFGMVYAITKYSFSVGHEISLKLFRNILYKKYQFHINRNSSQLISDITNKANNIIYNGLLPYLRLISSLLFLGGILILMLTINPVGTLLIFIISGSFYCLLIKLLKSKIKLNSELATRENVNLIRLIQEAVGGIREIILSNGYYHYLSTFTLSSKKLREAQSKNTFMEGSPRFLIETLILLLFGIVILLLNVYSSELIDNLPMLMLIGLSAQKMLPLFQTIYSSWASIQSVSCDLTDLSATLSEGAGVNISSKINAINNLNFSNKILFNNVSFSYDGTNDLLLKNISLHILKGKTTGVIGISGSGKSTFLDLFAGLIEPTSGQIYIDNEPLAGETVMLWQQKIAYVSQNVFLSDCSIAENIAIGSSLKEIDYSLLNNVCHKAQLSDLISMLPDGYMSIVGERGSRLSGGQRQRIGIARALYKKCEIIIFDEATSALDVKTENSVMQTINNLDSSITVIIVAHRTSTLSHCDHIYEVKNNTIELVQ